ncbi:DUF5979 domain-containing protein [Actinomyces howellii]|uniref:T surface-antigen of pili n=1 Tax=Actinomyces howellii TaxID=52771 RepID=A0A3S4RGS2_9ACTO|nr:DUF5979 domain-containing protein [Actinomyces howellii]VEG29674.1 T surface-antigen of pili [Actinomyces howellii]
MQTLAPRRDSSSGRSALAIVCLGLVALVLGLVVPVQVQAAVNSRITVSNLVLVRSDIVGAVSSGYLTNDDVARLTFDWDASQADIASGDSFSINLGTYFNNLEYPKTTEMSVSYNGQEVGIGTCELTQKELTCTFNDKVDELKRAGFGGFSGTGSALLKVTGTTTSETVDFSVNASQTVSVDLPGEGGIRAKGAATYSPGRFSKVAALINSQSTGTVWEINYGSAYLQGLLKDSDQALVLDGSTRQTITFTDTLGAGQAFSTDLSRWMFMVRNSAAEPDLTGVPVVDAAGKDLNATYGDFDMSVSIDGQVATITVTGPFAQDTNYKVYYPVTFTSETGKALVGVKYANSATVAGSDSVATATRSYISSVSITVKMAAGYGGFGVTKYLEGSGLAEVAAGTTFDVKVDYTLPAAASVYAAEGWTAPGTLNADGTTGSTTMKVVIGESNTYPGTFPKGTVVTLSEDTSTASTSGPYSWGEPVFSVGNKATSTFTVGDQTSTAVSLTNTATALGTFEVVKTVSGAEGAAAKDYSFSYTCTDGQSGTVSAKGDGVAVPAGASFALGTECTLTEDEASAAIEGYTLSAPAAQTVTISSATTPVTATFTNSYAKDEGAFSVAKSVEGGESSFAAGTYAFTYTCTDGSSGTLSVPGDGTVVTSPGITAGATCTVSEDAASAAKDGYSVASTLSADTVTIVKGQTSAVTATNTYTRDTGTFTVAKAVTGDYNPSEADTVTVRYECNDPQATSGSLELGMNGQPVEGPVVPTGTTCTVSEDAASAARAGFAVATSYSSTAVTVVKDSTPAVTVTNSYTLLTGGFTVSKTVAGDGAALAPAEFTFDYTCTTAAAGPDVTGTLTVAAGSSASVTDLPVGSCTVTERTAGVEGAELETTMSVDGTAVDGASATVEVTEGSGIEVAAVNTYTLERGGFEIVKTVAGDDAQTIAQRSFTVDYSCTSVEGERTGSVEVPGDGTAAAGPADLPVGATCTLSERATSAGVDQYDVVIPEAQTITVANPSQVVTASFTNTYTRHTGSFAVTKSVSGASGQAVQDKEFSFTYTCSDSSTGELTVKADGTAVAGPTLPTGTECTITEDTASAGIDGHTLVAPEPQTVTITDKGEVVTASFTNTYTPNPTPTPSATPSESPSAQASGTPTSEPGSPAASLARTGASIAVPVIIVVALLAGGVMLLRRRRA